ncbi:MAG: carbohydrate kinase family protein, partial [Phycisphaerae bacterium]
MNPGGEIAVVGHVCLDVIPTFLTGPGDGVALAPGTLVKVGPAVRSTGGAVSNTGLALHRLGVGVRLVGKVGADLFGREVLAILEAQGVGLASGMK